MLLLKKKKLKCNILLIFIEVYTSKTAYKHFYKDLDKVIVEKYNNIGSWFYFILYFKRLF